MKHTLMEETIHEHKQVLASQTLSHAKGHYLATVSFNRSIAGWETDPGSVPSLQGCTIWQQQHISVSSCVHVRTHLQIWKCLSVRRAGISEPLWENACYHLFYYSVRLACLCGAVYVCLCARVHRTHTQRLHFALLFKHPFWGKKSYQCQLHLQNNQFLSNAILHLKEICNMQNILLNHCEVFTRMS